MTAATNAAALTGSFGYPATISFRTSKILTANGTTFSGTNFDAVDIGTAATGRRVVIGVNCEASGVTPNVTAVSVGGNAATEVIELTAADRVSSLWIVTLDTGTTANISVTVDNTCLNCGIGVWALYDLRSSTPVNTQVNTAVGDDPFPALTTAWGGVAIWTVGSKTALSTFTFTGGPTERYDATVESPASHAGADSTTTGSSITLSVDVSDASSLHTGVAASFR